MLQTTFLLVRHGETDWNRNHRMQGSTDIPLNAFGIEQAKLLNPHLRTYTVDTIYVSPLTRARQTAEHAFSHYDNPMKFDSRLQERSFGAFEGMSFDQVILQHPAMRYPESWNYPDYRPPQGESVRDVQQRMVEAARDIAKKHRGDTISIVSHGSALGSLLVGILNLPFSTAMDYRLDNTSLSIIRIDTSGNVSLELLNYTKHLVE